jgi:hypothetical protein
MKQLLPVLALVALTTACSTTNTADNKSANTTTKTTINKTGSLPTEEKAFVKAIEDLDRKEIIAQLGEPAKADDVRIKGTDKIVASIWHYHYINTGEDGEYYQTTELDFIDNKVVQVVFLNNDGSEEAKDAGQSYEIPKNKPN